MRKDFAQGFFFLRQLQVRNTGCWELARARVVSLAWHHGMGDLEQKERAIEISSAREEGANGGAKRKERE